MWERGKEEERGGGRELVEITIIYRKVPDAREKGNPKG